MKESKISWCNYSWNPWQGCHKVSEGCRACYMFRDKERYGQDPNVVVRSSKPTFDKPLKIDKPSLIFTCSWSDFFVEEADGWRDEAWGIIRKTPQHTYQILTKRPERIIGHLPVPVLSNVWLGVSIENNKHSDRAEVFNKIGGYTTFISFEPLLEKIEWQENYGNVDWIIIGAESGNENGKYKYRDCQNEWIIDLINEAKSRGIKVFVKQTRMNGKLLTNIENFPKELQIREYPNEH
ncbi:MAG: DUF5131 family protein [Ignavibacteriales bacterium]|nr:DUF5131 family protein [Ignavibacteriales bacterium]